MALAAVGFAKATRRRQIMVATSSIGPGATNMVTAAGVAHANRLPLLLLAGDTFQSRDPRSGAAAGRALRRPDDDGQRRLQAGHPLLGPDHPARAARALAAARAWRRCSTRRRADRRSSACRRTSRPRRSSTPIDFFDVVVHEVPAAAARPCARSSRAAERDPLRRAAA